MQAWRNLSSVGSNFATILPCFLNHCSNLQFYVGPQGIQPVILIDILLVIDIEQSEETLGEFLQNKDEIFELNKCADQ